MTFTCTLYNAFKIAESMDLWSELTANLAYQCRCAFYAHNIHTVSTTQSTVPFGHPPTTRITSPRIPGHTPATVIPDRYFKAIPASSFFCHLNIIIFWTRGNKELHICLFNSGNDRDICLQEDAPAWCDRFCVYLSRPKVAPNKMPRR